MMYSYISHTQTFTNSQTSYWLMSTNGGSGRYRLTTITSIYTIAGGNSRCRHEGRQQQYMFTERAHTLLLFVIDNIVFVVDITLFVTAVRSGLDECIVFIKEFCSFLLDIVALCICY